jgi:hypothetical protein
MRRPVLTGNDGRFGRSGYILVPLFRSAGASIRTLSLLSRCKREDQMTPLKTLAAAAAIALGLMTVADSASARRGGGGHGGGGHHHGGHHHGGHHGHVSFGFWGGGYWPGYWGGGYWPGYWGGGYWPGYWRGGYWGPGWGGYYGAPAYAYTPVVVQEPRVWVENDPASATPPPAAAPNANPNAQQWWYWCVSARKYYPYVGTCAEGWQRVAPQPTPSTQ